MKMIDILLLIILQSLSSVLCLNCSDVRQSIGFGVYTRREPNGSRSYWISNKKGSEWELYLNESNGQIDIERISDETHYDNRTGIIRFSNFVQFQQFFVSYNCHSYVKPMSLNSIIACDVTQTEEHSKEVTQQKFGQLFRYQNRLIFKTFPMRNDISLGIHWITYNRHNKNDRFKLGFYRIQSSDYELYIVRHDLPDIEFIRQMNDSLFSQIDSMIDYNWEGMTGHMLWFNIDHKHYYCFQPEGQPLSEQVNLVMDLK